MGGDVETIVVYVSVEFTLNKLFNGNWLLFKHSKKKKLWHTQMYHQIQVVRF